MVVREVAFANRTGIRLVDLAKVLPLERPTIHRLLKTLIEERLVTQDVVTRKYFLGQGLFELGLTAATRFNPRELCQPILQHIADETEDTVFLLFRSGLEVVCVDRKDGSFPIKVFSMNVGDRRPLGTGAGGLAILSALPDDEIERAINITRSKKRRIVDNVLLEEIKKTRRNGFAVHEGELAEVRALAVPIRDVAGQPFAALSFTAINARVEGDRLKTLVTLLQQGAKELEKLINQHDRLEWNA